MFNENFSVIFKHRDFGTFQLIFADEQKVFFFKCNFQIFFVIDVKFGPKYFVWHGWQLEFLGGQTCQENFRVSFLGCCFLQICSLHSCSHAKATEK